MTGTPGLPGLVYPEDNGPGGGGGCCSQGHVTNSKQQTESPEVPALVLRLYRVTGQALWSLRDIKRSTQSPTE